MVSYLNKYHREKLIKDLTPLLECIEYNCYLGPDIHYTPIDSEEETAINHCEGCGEELTDILGGLDKELIKLGFLTGGGAHDVLQKLSQMSAHPPFLMRVEMFSTALLKSISLVM